MKRAVTVALILLFLPLSALGSEDKGDKLFTEALDLYQSLTKPRDSKHIENNKELWRTVAKAFHNIYIEYPTTARAPDALFLAGKMYEEIGSRFNSKAELYKSIDLSRQFIRGYPYSDQADDAQIRIARITERFDKSRAYWEYDKIIKEYPDGDMTEAARNKRKELAPYKREEIKYQVLKEPPTPGGLLRVTRIRSWAGKDYTRVVIHVDKKARFFPHLLKADPSLNTPPRLYVDIDGATVVHGLETPTTNLGLVREIRYGRNKHNTVRVVLYLTRYKGYKVFALRDPFRIVLDVYGNKKPPAGLVAKSTGKVRPGSMHTGRNVSTPPETLRDVLGLKVRTIVIDPGHGGHDPGAIGPSGIKEKTINLAIAKALKRSLEKNTNVERVILTRSKDKFISLRRRTAIARRNKADLFISIHCNASKNKRAHGIETYVLSFTQNKDSLAVAARENATNRRGLSDLKDIIKKYVLSSKIDESITLAETVQTSMVSNLNKHYRHIKSKGVKKAPFVVLIGADVPSILVETSFITNPREEKRLKNSRYINKLAEGIVAGIRKYSESNQTAYLNN